MTWRQLAYRMYWKLERVITPGLRSTQYDYRDALLRYLERGSGWLDVGCGHAIFPDWVGDSARAAVARAGCVVGIEYDIDSLRQHALIRNRVVGDIERAPFRPDSFDVVTANMVIEHIQNPDRFLRNVRVVLRPGGFLIAHTPNIRNYKVRLAALLPQALKNRLIAWFKNRHEDDVFPTLYRMNSEAAIRDLASRSGFRVVEFRSLNSSASTVVLGPVVIAELLATRLLNTSALSRYRSNLIFVLQRV